MLLDSRRARGFEGKPSVLQANQQAGQGRAALAKPQSDELDSALAEGEGGAHT